MKRFDLPPTTILVRTQTSNEGEAGQLSQDGVRFIGDLVATVNLLQVQTQIDAALIADLEARVTALENP